MDYWVSIDIQLLLHSSAQPTTVDAFVVVVGGSGKYTRHAARRVVVAVVRGHVKEPLNQIPHHRCGRSALGASID